MELVISIPLKEWEPEPLPEDFKIHMKFCDEWDEPVIEIWRKVA